MNSKSHHLVDETFIEKQRRRLTRLRAALVSAADGLEIDENSVNSESKGGPAEREDDAQRLTTLEIDGILVAYDPARLNRVERALEKIAERTYGRSDASGQPIPMGRLEAIPETIYTLAEELVIEQKSRT
jgi:DnaK suppressor protein